MTAVWLSAKCRTSRSVSTDFSVIRDCLWRESLMMSRGFALSATRKDRSRSSDRQVPRRGFVNLDGVALRFQGFLELIQEKLHIIFRRQWPHHADTENLARQRPKAAGNFDSRPVQQTLADFAFVNARGHANCIQRGNAMLLRNVHLQAHRFNPLDERSVAAAVPLPAILDAFLRNHRERLAQGIEH